MIPMSLFVQGSDSLVRSLYQCFITFPVLKGSP